MKSILSVLMFVLIVCGINVFAQTASEKNQLAKKIKADHDISLSVSEIASEMTVQKIDLNADGKPEYIVHGIRDFCGGGQCNHYIYRKSGAKFVNISGSGIYGQYYKIGKTRTNGYLNISFKSSEFSGGAMQVYKFNGSSYQ